MRLSLTVTKGFPLNLLKRIVATLVLSLITASVFSQNINYPNKPVFKKHTSEKYQISIDFPVTWSLDDPFRNEIFISVGELRGLNAVCLVRMSEVENLSLSNEDDYWANLNEQSFVKLLSGGMPDIKVHLFQMSQLSNRKTRQIIYSGTDGALKTQTLSYQTLDGDRIYTVSCVSEAAGFLILFNDFEAIVSSFHFIN